MASASLRIAKMAEASAGCWGRRINRSVLRVIGARPSRGLKLRSDRPRKRPQGARAKEKDSENPGGGRLLSRRNRLPLPPLNRTIGPSSPEPGSNRLRGFPKPSQATLTVPEAGAVATVLPCPPVLCMGYVDFPQHLLGAILTTRNTGNATAMCPTAAVPGPNRRSGAEMLGKLQALALIVGAQRLAVTLGRRIG
jgi:hypothetical protein